MSVYFIKVGRYIKVGYSENPERRCKRLWSSTTRYGRPWDLSLEEPRELLHAVEGDKEEERACHRALDDFWAASEWFIDEPEVRGFIDLVATYDHIYDVELPHVERPSGCFVPVPHTQMLPERVVELDGMLRRAREKALA